MIAVSRGVGRHPTDADLPPFISQPVVAPVRVFMISSLREPEMRGTSGYFL
jgi:hypothetical protein